MHDRLGEADARQWRVRLRDGTPASLLASALVERGFGLEELRAEGSALEETFLSIAAGAPAEAA